VSSRFSSSEAFGRLREKAEQLLKEKGIETPDFDKLDLLRLTHELEVYQVELELQNQELRDAKAEIEESRDEFFDLYESAPVAYVTLDEKGIIERANKAAHQMFRGSEQLLLGSSFLLRIHPEDIFVYSSLMKQLAFDQVQGPFGLRLRGGNGEMIHMQAAITGKMEEKDGLKHYRLALVDITERKRMEDELRRSRDELELRVQERTAELETYTRKLQESNRALQEFASIASHDMQEPLRKIISFGNMLKQGYADSLGNEGKDFLNRMVNATERMQTLLTSLLDYSRITTRTEAFRSVDLAAIVREVLSDLEVRIKKTGGEVHISDLPTIEADPMQMRQLFQNLIGNALKFHREGEKPSIEVKGRSLGDGITELVVKDNGIGFDEKYLDRIFMPFQRLHERSAYEGTGMGLAICSKIVERHGGTITATSTQGKGSTFIMTLSKKQMQPKTGC
jgi:PAS domain S-box-containing protein